MACARIAPVAHNTDGVVQPQNIVTLIHCIRREVAPRPSPKKAPMNRQKRMILELNGQTDRKNDGHFWHEVESSMSTIISTHQDWLRLLKKSTVDPLPD
jgi:hypothetical protein